MSDKVFRGLLIHEAEILRPTVELDPDGVPKTPTFQTLVPAAACRLTPARAVSSDELLGRTGDASHVLYLEPMDVRVADRITIRPVRTSLSEDAPQGSTELKVTESTGLAAGNKIEVGCGDAAEVHMIASVSGKTIILREQLEQEHLSGEAVSMPRHYEVLGVTDEGGAGHHLRAVVKELV